jgi:hypothetical protein
MLSARVAPAAVPDPHADRRLAGARDGATDVTAVIDTTMVEIPVRPGAVLDDEIIVEYGMFTLQDQAPTSPLASEMAADDDAILATGRGGATFHSGETDHYAAVKIEFWPAEPDALAGQWDAVEQGVMSVESTAIRLRSILAVMTPTFLNSRRPEGTQFEHTCAAGKTSKPRVLPRSHTALSGGAFSCGHRCDIAVDLSRSVREADRDRVGIPFPGPVRPKAAPSVRVRHYADRVPT